MEGRLLLASQALHNNHIQSQNKAAVLFQVPRTTLRRRLTSIQPRSSAHLKQRNLRQVEEQSLVQWILDLNRRGFPPQIIDVRRMADVLLAARGQDPPPPPIGKN